MYMMSLFKLPVGIVHDIHKLFRDFWLGYNGKNRTHWFTWEKLCLLKIEGGLGFKDMSLFNQALLAKQVWRLMQNRNSLLFQVLRSKYFPFGNVLYILVGNLLFGRVSVGVRSFSKRGSFFGWVVFLTLLLYRILGF